MFKFSWRTTLLGGSLILGGLGHIVGTGDFSFESITSILTGIGLILGKDFNVSGGNKAR